MSFAQPRPSRRSHAHSALGLAALLLLSAWASSAPAQGLPTPYAPTGEEVQIAAEALPEQADAAIAEGQRLEAAGQWADAVAHYEQALRDYPSDRRLERRFDLARLHSNLERRYADTSFLDTLAELNPSSALDIHAELLSKIESHYVVTPPWERLTRRGATAVLVASSEPAFAGHHGVRPSEAQRKAFANEVRRRFSSAGPIRNAREALRLTADLSRLAQRRFGAPAAVWTMEFVAAAAGGLDHYSSFLTPGQLRDVYSQIEGNFVGLGIELKADGGALQIVRVIPGSPADRAGIAAGDRITAVDGQQTADLSTDEAASLLTGEEGSIAEVTVVGPTPLPEGSTDVAHLVAKPPVRELRVRREHVEVPSLEGAKIVDEDYGVAYLRIPVFQKSTSRDIEAALWDLHRAGMRTLVIDLRGNPGGLLTSSVELADKFIAQGNLVSTRGRSDGEDFDYRAHRAGTWRVPLVVLIDGDSASASEIFAAAIRDNHRGSIVGERSFGKGSVQGIFPMTRGGAGVRLTTAKFFSPNGHPISKVGVNPDIVVRHATSVAGGQEEQRVAGYRGVSTGADSTAPAGDLALSRAIKAARQQAAMR